jgi:hypothetical protein
VKRRRQIKYIRLGTTSKSMSNLEDEALVLEHLEDGLLSHGPSV